MTARRDRTARPTLLLTLRRAQGHPEQRRGMRAAFLLLLLAASAAAQPPTPAAPPAPPLPMARQIAVREGWLARRYETLLPMMRAHGVGMWVVVSEEFHDDPLSHLIAPPRPYVGRRDVFVFTDAGTPGLVRTAIVGYSEEHVQRFFDSPNEPVLARESARRPRREALAEDDRPLDRRRARRHAQPHLRRLPGHRRGTRPRDGEAHRPCRAAHRGVPRHAHSGGDAALRAAGRVDRATSPAAPSRAK